MLAVVERAAEQVTPGLGDELRRAGGRERGGRPVGAPDERADRRRVDRGRGGVQIRDRFVARDEDVGGLLRLGRVVEAGDGDVGRERGESRRERGEEIVERVQVFVVAETAERRRTDRRTRRHRNDGAEPGAGRLAAAAPRVHSAHGSDEEERRRSRKRLQAAHGGFASPRAAAGGWRRKGKLTRLSLAGLRASPRQSWWARPTPARSLPGPRARGRFAESRGAT